MCVQKLIRNIILAVGLIFVILAVSCNLFWEKLLRFVMEKELILSSSSKSYSLWVENPMPFYIDFYFFNWTNPTELKTVGYKPKFSEVGPFRFREEIKKTEIKFNENKTVSYRKLRRWYFESDGSNGSLNDTITSINIIALTAARITRYWNKVARIPLSVALSSSQKLSITKPVREFLFEGFSDPLIELASKIPGLASQVPFDRFGWFYKRNDSSDFDGVFNIETGANGFDVLGKIKFWNFNNHTSFYEGQCGRVDGSAGDFWPPQNSHGEKITLFSPDMCRYIDFIYKKEETVRNIKGFRYDSGFTLFDNGTFDPTNKCFCNGKCYPSGMVNVSNCRFGAPAFVSYPHFHLADPFYLNSIDGLKPDPRYHDMYIILEQILPAEKNNRYGLCRVLKDLKLTGITAEDLYLRNTLRKKVQKENLKLKAGRKRIGEYSERIKKYWKRRKKWGIPLEVAIRLQINILMEPDSGIRMFDRVPTVIFPMIWFEQKVTIPESMSEEIGLFLELPKFGLIASGVLYIVGLSFVTIYVLDRYLKNGRD